MEIVPENVARGLRYLDAMTAAGVGVPNDAFNAFVRQPAPRFSARYGFAELADSMSHPLSYLDHNLLNPGEYFVKTGWAYVDQTRALKISELGRALVRALGAPTSAANEQADFVRIDPEDPVAYARVFSVIAGLDEVLIVDRYLTRDGLLDLAGVPSVARVLTGRRKELHTDGVVTVALRRMNLELRTIDDTELHDRWILPRNGDPSMLGSSFNSIDVRPGVVVPLTNAAAAAAIRRDFEQLWERAVKVAPAPDATSETEAGVD